jgi:hypothetical protein
MARTVCPECEEPAQAKQPTTWNKKWGPKPDASHLDGEPLCPVIGANGYEPAKPVTEGRS